MAGNVIATDKARMVPIAEGWAGNSNNTVIFRRNSVVTDGDMQYVAFYDETGHVVLTRRVLGSSDWEIRQTPLVGKVADAHNCISLMVDGDGYLHLSWDHHNNRLRYVRSVAPGSLDLTGPLSMTGQVEDKVTYPQFDRLAGGDLLFFYRDGMSGNGNLMLNRYSTRTQQWTQIQNGFIDGEGERNAYWQIAIDRHETIHLSWVWRETPDVATNHDLCYACSHDGGVTWQKSTGEVYDLPITQGSAEIACPIPQGHELINQTSMCADALGRPYIASYWRPPGTEIPQYHLVYHDGENWQVSQVSQRQTPFTLGGVGTRRIPISRPLIVAAAEEERTRAYLVFRDEERGNCVSMASCDNLGVTEWRVEDLTESSVGFWEPTYDSELWESAHELHLFVQFVGQGEREGVEAVAAQMVSILEHSA
ncbi:MAG: BNR repeat-containing protein [Caldilineaceae bacterium]